MILYPLILLLTNLLTLLVSTFQCLVSMLEALPGEEAFSIMPSDLLQNEGTCSRFDPTPAYYDLHLSVTKRFASFFAKQLLSFSVVGQRFKLTELESYCQRMFLVLRAIMTESISTDHGNRLEYVSTMILLFLEQIRKSLKKNPDAQVREAITTRCIASRAFISAKDRSTLQILDVLVKHCVDLQFHFCHHTKNELVFVRI